MTRMIYRPDKLFLWEKSFPRGNNINIIFNLNNSWINI